MIKFLSYKNNVYKQDKGVWYIGHRGVTCVNWYLYTDKEVLKKVLKFGKVLSEGEAKK